MALIVETSEFTFTALDMIKNAAIKLGAIQSGESLTADEANDSLNILNGMLEMWSNEKKMIYHIQQETLTWTANTASMTIGPTGDFNTTRPIKISEGTHFRDSNTIDNPVTILKDRTSYDRLPSKTDSTTFPEYMYYEPDYPLGVLYVYPVPSASITLNLNSWKQLQLFDLYEVLSLPPGYRHTIEHNLAVLLEPIFNITCPVRVEREAIKSRKILSRINHIPVYSSNEVYNVIDGRGRSDIEVG